MSRNNPRSLLQRVTDFFATRIDGQTAQADEAQDDRAFEQLHGRLDSEQAFDQLRALYHRLEANHNLDDCARLLELTPEQREAITRAGCSGTRASGQRL
jgi:hypothetical protein